MAGYGHRQADRASLVAGTLVRFIDCVNVHERKSVQPGGSPKDFTLRLAPLLMRRGLQVLILRDGTVEVRNPRGARMNQQIAIGDRAGVLWWFWVWSGATRDDSPELEPMCEATDIEQAAERVTKVLQVSGVAGS